MCFEYRVQCSSIQNEEHTCQSTSVDENVPRRWVLETSGQTCWLKYVESQWWGSISWKKISLDEHPVATLKNNKLRWMEETPGVAERKKGKSGLIWRSNKYENKMYYFLLTNGLPSEILFSKYIHTHSNEGRLSSTIFVHLIFFSLYQNDDVRTLTELPVTVNPSLIFSLITCTLHYLPTIIDFQQELVRETSWLSY